jgi:hypothetical protein
MYMYSRNFISAGDANRRLFTIIPFPGRPDPPTEDDKKDRRALLDGYVHDPTAALMGGVAGHAGLFASANDIAILIPDDA